MAFWYCFCILKYVASVVAFPESFMYLSGSTATSWAISLLKFNHLADEREKFGAREDRETAANPVPHAHKPGVAGVQLPDMRYVAGSSPHGCTPVRSEEETQQDFPLPA